MKKYHKWIYGIVLLNILSWVLSFIIYPDHPVAALSLVLLALGFSAVFVGLWYALRKKGLQSDMDLARAMGKDTKEALIFGQTGLISYDEEYNITWMSDYFEREGINLLGQKVTAFLPQVEALIQGEVERISGRYHNEYFEVERAPVSQVLFARNITRLEKWRQKSSNESLVIGLVDLDNYTEYQDYENDETLAFINSNLRTLVIQWAKNNDMFIRRIRSDRFLILSDIQTINRLRAENFPILQQFKDKAKSIDVSMSLSIALVYGSADYRQLDEMLSESLELVDGRGGDQVAIKAYQKPIEFIGGNSESSSQHSLARVKIVSSAIEDQIRQADRVFIVGHNQTDFDCFGAALAMSNWSRALKKDAYIVLKDVARDKQLDETMDVYRQSMVNRHTIISPSEALRMFSPKKDLVIMVDHGIASMSSGKGFLDMADRLMVIDHHRRSENFVKNPSLTYVESQASSTCELITELLRSSSTTVPIYEAEATMMYLGIQIDTNTFRSHTSERTLQAAAVLKGWGANQKTIQKALQEDFGLFHLKNALYAKARPYRDRFMIMVDDEPIDRTLLSKTADSLLEIKGVDAAFAIGINGQNGHPCISARSTGDVNVQTIMEKLGGGGHFSAAATEREDLGLNQLEALLKEQLDQLEPEPKN